MGPKLFLEEKPDGKFLILVSAKMLIDNKQCNSKAGKVNGENRNKEKDQKAEYAKGNNGPEKMWPDN